MGKSTEFAECQAAPTSCAGAEVVGGPEPAVSGLKALESTCLGFRV